MTKEEVLALAPKTCTKCGLIKDRVAFFTRIRHGQAHSHSECKECTKTAKKIWATTQAPYTRAYARQYYTSNIEACQERHRKWTSSKAGTGHYKRYWNKVKSSARKAVYYAVKRGILLKYPCVVCGDPMVEAHHPNYSKKLEVVWLCKKHHGYLNRKDAA